MSAPENKWLTFTRKMKWVLLGTLAALVGTTGGVATDTFHDNPWAAFIPVLIPFLLGYIPKEKPAKEPPA